MKISKLAGVVCGATFLLGTRVALADISITNTGATVSFTGFTAAGFQPAAATGGLSSNDWAISGFSDGDLNFGGTNNNADYTRGSTTTFPNATGGIYAPTTPADDFLAIRLSDADFSPGTLTARFKNTGTHKFVSLGIAYDLLVYNDNDRSSSVVFSWSTDNVNWTTPGGALTVNTPAALSASPAWVSTPKSTTITTNIAVNGNLYLRWSSDDVSGTGSRDAIGLDNIVITVPDACGDGVPQGAEECDDGNTVNTDACLNNCHIAACGDGVVRSTGATPEQCDSSAAMCCSNQCTKLTGTVCPAGTCAAGVCVPSTGGGGEGGDLGMAGDGSVAGDTGMGGAGEGGTMAGRGGRTGRGGRGGMAGTDASGGVPAAGSSGAPGAGSSGAPAAGTAGSGGAAPTAGSGGTATAGSSSGGKGGTAGSGNTGGKGGTSTTGGTGTKPPASGGSEDDGGCGCSVPRSSNHGTLALVFAGALAAFMRRRRRS